MKTHLESFASYAAKFSTLLIRLLRIGISYTLGLVALTLTLIGEGVLTFAEWVNPDEA